MTMNESKKELGQIIAFVNRHEPKKVDEIASAISVIKELVERDTPDKLQENCFCSNCMSKVNEYNPSNDRNDYCGQCGKHIYWME